MKFLRASIFILGGILCGPAIAQRQSSPPADQPSSSVEAVAQEEPPAQLAISEAQRHIKADAKKAQAYNELALAFLRRARETANPKYLMNADTALTEGLQVDSQDFQLQRTQVALLLARHEFAQAKQQATALHLRLRDDVMTFGFLAEAEIGLGDYSEAETNAQWMLNLRPNNIPALMIGAELRAIYGDPHGALEFFNLAYSETSPTEVEDLAWIATRIALIQIESGQADAAAQTLDQAERTFPNYPYALETLARLRLAQRRPTDAVQFLKQAMVTDPNPDIVFQLARAQEASGKIEEGHATYAQFEKLASDPGKATGESKLDLILLYAGSPGTAANALKLAQQEIAVRHDIWTLDAYAWALYANANYQDADAEEQKAISVGVQSAQIFDHAGRIAKELNHPDAAARYFKLAGQINPTSDDAANAQASAGSAAGMGDPQPTRTQTSETVPQNIEQGRTTNPAEISGQNALPAGTGMKASTPVFVPLPENLLIPHSTGTNRLIQSAQGTVARNPQDSSGYAALGAAYFQRARETGDVSDYQLAEQSLTRSLDLVSADFSAEAALGTMSSVCMGEHRFTDALSYAQKGLSLGTGDISSFAIVGDAYADMGEYDKAALAYSRLTPRDMTLSPRAAYARDSRLAYLKFIAGDTPEAISLMTTSVSEGIEAQLPAENLAWLYYELGEFSAQAGDIASADRSYMTALSIHPGDYRALAALGKLRANNGKYAEAIVLYQSAIAVVPMPIFIAELGDLYAKSGNEAEAKKQYDLVEYIGLLGHINQVLHNRDLALFYADHDMKLAEALDLAQKELDVRRDVYTWDALAWALYKNGKLSEAADASRKAMRFGTRDSLLLFHAAMIAEKMGQTDRARADLRLALQTNPHFHMIYADVAQQRLNALELHVASKEGPDQHAR